MRTYSNVPALRADVTASGSHFFSADSMRWFGTKFPESKVYGGRVFITSEQPPSGERIYVVRVVEDRSEAGEPLTVHTVFNDILDSPTELRYARVIAELVASQELPERFSYEDGKWLEDFVKSHKGYADVPTGNSASA